ncbi:hypothetical protein Ddc_18663 [Ditylenchus destructor]|nr:hypothetical protein Ddc_18663 [Ditylenchus destructor]
MLFLIFLLTLSLILFLQVNGDCCGMRDVFHGCCGKGRCNFLCCNCDKTSQGLCDVCCQHGDKCDWRTQPCCVWKKDDPKRCCRGTQNIFLDAPDRKTLEIETNNSSGREHALALFQKIDTNRDGRLDIPEVKAYLGREPTQEEFTSVDTNHNGFIDPHEFDDTL